VAGICGTDVKLYAQPSIDGPVIMGHENIGIVTTASPEFVERKGVSNGGRIFVEHYVGCYNCWDDTKRYVDALGLNDAESRRIFEANVRRLYPRLDAQLSARGR
jgi:threonine dehydrogenase-like Zn-dependent dehydrogenase